jgi:hypothetical protein
MGPFMVGVPKKEKTTERFFKTIFYKLHLHETKHKGGKLNIPI